MKRYQVLILGVLALISTWISTSEAQVELIRPKNAITYVAFPIRNAATGALITGATALDSECQTYSDGAAPGTLADCTAEAVEVATASGIYSLTLSAAETNGDYVLVLVKSTSTNAAPVVINVNTRQSLFNSTGKFQAGSTTTSLNLAAAESANTLVNAIILVDSGTGAKGFAVITAYDVGTKVATVSPALTNAPAAGDGYTIIPNGAASGGSADFTANERLQIKTALGANNVSSTPATSGQLQRLLERRD